jgi:hypothetical protein
MRTNSIRMPALAVGVALLALNAFGAQAAPPATLTPPNAARPDPVVPDATHAGLRFPLPSPSREAVTDGFEIVGHLDFPGTTGANADVWTFGDYAYVGVWQGAGCPANGVKVVNISDPTTPTQVAVLQNPGGTSAEDVVVRHVSTPSFTGDLAAVGIQDCSDDAIQGLQLWNVTDPTLPTKLGTWLSAVTTGGCHEIDLVQRADGRVLAGCSLPFARGAGQDEVVIVDATDPKHPVQAGSWVSTENGGIGCFFSKFAHSVRFFDGGDTLYVSNWDAGTYRLDVRNPATPQVEAQIRIAPPDEDGDSHSMTIGRGGELLFVNPEDFCSGVGNPWGEVRIFDNRNPASPHLLGSFTTPNAQSGNQDGTYTVHNTEVKGSVAFSSWYSDGIVRWSFKKPRNPQLLGQFVPPAQPMVWGVAFVEGTDLVVASDMNTGLWIVRPV